MSNNSLYKLSGDVAVLAKAIEELFNDEELQDDEREKQISKLVDEFSASKELIADKVENCVYFLRSIEADIDAAKKEEARFTSMRRAAQNKLEHMERYLERCLSMIEGGKVRLPTLRASLTTVVGAKIEIYDESLLPRDKRFWRFTSPVPDKVELKRALKDGEIRPEGVRLIDSKRLMWK